MYLNWINRWQKNRSWIFEEIENSGEESDKEENDKNLRETLNGIFDRHKKYIQKK